MHLKCKVCQAVQQVSMADEADEDLRTQLIRRTFRAEHLASCGENEVSLVLHSINATVVDPTLWSQYLADRQPPADVIPGADGFFTRTIHRDGQAHQVRVCEDCWENIPRYVHYPAGLISPESDGAGGVVAKLRPTTVDTDSPERSAAVEHLWKAVCVPCYERAFLRVYGKATLPLSQEVIGDGTPVEPPPPVAAESVGRVSVSRWDREAVV